MTKPEKVVKGLECCIKRDPEDDLRCEACPYPAGSACANRLKIDALELLKAQIPRVLTLEEVKTVSREPAWFESHGTFRGGKGFWVLLGDLEYRSTVKELMCAAGMSLTELGLAAYGSVWRCWTARPTDEQRETTPWDELPKEDRPDANE